MRAPRRTLAAIFAGDRRIWLAAATAAIPLLTLLGYYVLRPRLYFTGTNSVEPYTYVVPTPAGAPMCVPGLRIPVGTARIRLSSISRTSLRPVLHATIVLPGRTIRDTLPAEQVGSGRISSVELPIPTLRASAASVPATVCVTAADLVNWAGTPLLAPPAVNPPTLQGRPINARIAVWYLPPVGSERSYLSRIGSTLHRAALFRPGFVGPWLYYLLLLLVLPGISLLAVRTLALASANRPMRATPALLFALAVLNFCSWALITPPFQGPDEVDHFAYTQSLAERGQSPSGNASSPRARWSSSESLSLEDMSFFTDHQVGDTHPPWLPEQQREYEADVRQFRPSHSNGGGNETAATHGPVYYAALIPGYAAGGSSPFSELTLMRFLSALIGALVPMFTFLLARELAPGRQWLAILAALLVIFQPMYGFISGAVNNDVGVNAGAAALELLLIRVLRRGITVRDGLLIGVLLAFLPQVKGTIVSLYPVAVLALLAAIWRWHLPAFRARIAHPTQARALAGVAALIAAAAVAREAVVHISAAFADESVRGGELTVSAVNAGRAALEHPLDYLDYLWQVFLPRLSFMAPHFEGTGWPAFVIFVERGWGAFGWYDVLFPHWLYDVILAAMVLIALLALVSLRLEWRFVRAHAVETGLLVLMPIAVVAGVEAAFYTPGIREVIAEFGRYAFPAIAPLAVLTVAALHGVGRRLVPSAGAILLVAMLALSYAAQLLTLTNFYA